jgi:hypothetical protein
MKACGWCRTVTCDTVREEKHRIVWVIRRNEGRYGGDHWLKKSQKREQHSSQYLDIKFNHTKDASHE